MAQSVEQLLSTPEIRSLNPNMGKVLSSNCTLIQNGKDENKEEDAGKGPPLKNTDHLLIVTKSPEQPNKTLVNVFKRTRYLFIEGLT